MEGEEEEEPREKEEQWEEEPSAEDQAQLEQMKQVYKSMHFWFKIRVEGSITETNALYADESEVVLMDMNVKKAIMSSVVSSRHE